MMTPAEVRHLEAERQRLTRRIGWALRRKHPERAERLERELAHVEARLARAEESTPPRRVRRPALALVSA